VLRPGILLAERGRQVGPEKLPRRERAEDLISLLVPDWRPSPRQRVWAIRIACVSGILVAIGYLYDITLWDWAKLLIIPAVIAGGGLWFNRQQRERELEIARERREQEVGIAERRAQDEALQAYLDQIGQLLLDKEWPLRQSKEDDEVRTLARARTLTILARLDGDRKARVVQFLYESGLLNEDRIVDLDTADLSGARLTAARLSGANLSGSNLREASLSRADLKSAILRNANLIEADLSGARLYKADLIGAKLNRSNLYGAFLREADLVDAKLNGSNLRGAILTGAHFTSANFEGVDLSVALVTTEQVQNAKSLEGATIPNGQKYEHWIKDR
jgi:uncharacterized protein YjbI with pentapeptide repeats